LLLKEKHLVPIAGHQTPTAEEIRGRKYCKWYNKLDVHNTVDCRILSSKFRELSSMEGWSLLALHKDRYNAFPVNMVYTNKSLLEEDYSVPPSADPTF